MENINKSLKEDIVNICSEMMFKQKERYEIEIEETQEQANQFKGAMESRYDSFKEELQDRKNLLTLQYYKVLEKISLLRKIDLGNKSKVEIGAIVEIEDYNKNISNYFIFYNITTQPILFREKKYYLLSLDSPFGNMVKNRKIGDSFNFRDKYFKVISIL